ncbi:hypothetical protein FMZ60_09075 [Alcaligenaceae bacterium SJ-26]|nr:hypothetical protein FMZ60_09075 [Alcaligenaceae bacterium SJ-26]
MDWFKNLQVYRLPSPWNITAEALEAQLAAHAYQPGSGLEAQRLGWIAPREGGSLVHEVGRQLLIALRAEKKLLPASVVNQVAKARAAELEEQQGFKPGRKQMKDLKEQVTDVRKNIIDPSEPVSHHRLSQPYQSGPTPILPFQPNHKRRRRHSF